ncbi:hypothetical protein T552_01145 [Pneumocystis carinii B80]|uniref:Polynucleotide 5'-hydroxyl-kinase GRC3 n=1 Tax=Pneumocystis carinii (strain B80) TaxID=1408658 RepID=A0A0W4ZLE5_PNEC8|nr:hypothetical protein T552_01145 [Pneumocystis carinii B80]KTW29188.1 hypothetical protein T552_01145 [Pneumocystis carinii B80]
MTLSALAAHKKYRSINTEDRKINSNYEEVQDITKIEQNNNNYITNNFDFSNSDIALKNINEISIKKNLQIISKPSINKHFLDKNGYTVEIFGFYAKEKLILQGFYEFKVIKGVISIMSSEFDSSNTSQWYRIFSLSTHSIPVISSVLSDKNSIETSCFIHSKEICSFIRMLDSFLESIICVRSINDNLIKIKKFHTFSKYIWEPNEKKEMKNTYNIIDDFSSYPLLNIPESWSSAINIIHSSNFDNKTARIIICGPKLSGKSTFAKNLINKFLTGRYNEHKAIEGINYIETDPGQPEFSPHGIISSHYIKKPVINPSFTHCTLPSLTKAHFLGNISPQNNPKHFLLCVNDIFNTDKKNVPTIINTPGWTKGMGLELLNEIINLSNCTYLVYIGSKTNVEIFDTELILPSSVKLLTLPSVREFINTCGTVKINTADLRALSIISYFHSINISEDNCHTSWEFDSYLLDMKPWIVKYDGDLNGIDAISILNTTLDIEEFYYAINGTIMAFVVADNITENNEKTWESIITKSKDRLPILNTEKNPIDPKISQCIGLCILRGISRKSKELQILTPIDTLTLNKYLNSNKKIILVRGNLELPISLMINYKKDKDAKIDWDKAPYLSLENEGLGSKVWHPRKNIERPAMRT